MPDRVAGITRITCNGTAWRVRGSVAINGAESVKEPVVGTDGFHGTKEKPRVPTMKLNITPDRGVSLRALYQINGATVICEGPTGAQYILADATYGGEHEYDPEEGQQTLEFFGSFFREVPAR